MIKENIDAVVVATVTENQILSCTGMVKRLLTWNVVSLIQMVCAWSLMLRLWTRMSNFQKNVKINADTLEADTLAVLSDLNHASQKVANHL